MADALYSLLKIVHVVTAALWLGAGFLNAFVLQRILAVSQPEVRREFGGRLFQALFRYINAMAGITLLSGLALVWRHPYGFESLGKSTWGNLVLFALIGTLLVMYLINFAIRPTYRAIGKIQAAMDPDMPAPAALRFMTLRLRFSSILSVLLLLSVFVAMVGANLYWAGP